MKAEAYEQGNFTFIECPLILPEYTGVDEWKHTLNKMGYHLKYQLDPYNGDPYLVVWGCALSVDSDYPYFVEFNCLDEGRLIFMKKWYDVTHFINNHCLLLNLELIDHFLGYVKCDDRPWNQRNYYE